MGARSNGGFDAAFDHLVTYVWGRVRADLRSSCEFDAGRSADRPGSN